MQPLTHTDFASLQPGDELLVRAGCSTSDGELEQDITVVVAKVDGFSFLTTDGDGFGGCHAAGFVYKTGNVREVVLSEKAQQVLADLDLD